MLCVKLEKVYFSVCKPLPHLADRQESQNTRQTDIVGESHRLINLQEDWQSDTETISPTVG